MLLFGYLLLFVFSVKKHAVKTNGDLIRTKRGVLLIAFLPLEPSSCTAAFVVTRWRICSSFSCFSSSVSSSCIFFNFLHSSLSFPPFSSLFCDHCSRCSTCFCCSCFFSLVILFPTCFPSSFLRLLSLHICMFYPLTLEDCIRGKISTFWSLLLFLLPSAPPLTSPPYSVPRGSWPIAGFSLLQEWDRFITGTKAGPTLSLFVCFPCILTRTSTAKAPRGWYLFLRAPGML